jgi:hypothetical protein
MENNGESLEGIEELVFPEGRIAVPAGRLLDLIEGNTRTAASLAATRFRLLHGLQRQWDADRDTASDPARISFRSLRAEIAAALALPERTVESMLGIAEILVSSLPTTLDRLAEGRFSERHARVLAEVAAGLEKGVLAEFERRALDWADCLTVAKFDRKIRTLREMLQPSAATERHRAAVAEREVRTQPARDGMAYLTALLPAPKVLAIDGYLTELSRSLQVEGEERTLTQLRADVLADLLLDDGALLPPGEGEAKLRERTKGRGIVPTVHVTVPALTLTGRSDEPGILEGYGPIDPETARELCGAATGFHRILTNPGTGAVVSFGRDRYAVPAELRAYLRARDGTCRFVGCGRPARFCDLDHTRDWLYQGETNAGNLAHLCRSHHHLKHASSWRPEHVDTAGTLEWTSALGRRHRTHPELALPDAPMPQTEWREDDPPPF